MAKDSRGMRRRVTRVDVARRARVSVATVSYVINEGPRPVAAATRTRVLRAIRALDFRPSEVARSLRLQRTRMIGLILPDTANPFFASLAKGIDDVVFAHGYSLLLCHSGYVAAREQAYAEVMLAKGVDGVIYIQGTTDASALHRLLRYRLPTVAVDREVPDAAIDRVVVDNFGGSEAAARHLIALGHRQIACIARHVPLSNAAERIRGYRAALAEAGIPANPDYLVPGGPGYEEGHRAMTALLDLRPRPTAVLAYPDVVAIGAIRAAQDADLRVPGDISVVGFDDIPVAAFLQPALTTVVVRIREMGQRAIEVLLARIEGREGGAPQRIVLPTTLVVRESTGAPPMGPRSSPRLMTTEGTEGHG
jgi:LacI family transcriptional regulator